MKGLLGIFSAGGVPASLAINAVAIAHLLQAWNPGIVDWHGLFGLALNFYDGVYLNTLAPVQSFLASKAGISLPAWSADFAVLYASTAGALSVSGPVVSAASAVERPASALLGLAWPIAFVTFVFNAIRTRAITGFAGRHSGLFALYLVGVAAAFGGAVYVNNALH